MQTELSGSKAGGIRVARVAFALVAAISVLLLGPGCASQYEPNGTQGLPDSHRALSYEPARQTGEDSNQALASIDSGIDEVWVIARSSEVETHDNDAPPGTGSLTTSFADGQREIPLPLRHTGVEASVRGCIATVDVTQQFQNPYKEKIEAAYVFPLPHNAAISEFIMTVGERRIRGIIRERSEAEEIYRAAKQQGRVASLLTQERPNVFTQNVANIEPGKSIDVHIRYFNTLTYDDGWYEFVFPMVVGPRFNPPGSTDGSGAVARGSGGSSGQSTDIQYLSPNETNGHDVALTLDVQPGVAIEDWVCRTHHVVPEIIDRGRLVVSLDQHSRIPNRDFVFRYRVAGQRIKSNLLTTRDRRGGYFTLMLYPPEDLRELTRQPVELVFVLDSSGSMNGPPMTQARAAVERGLRCLRPGDSFQLINFASRSSRLGPRPLEATSANIHRGLKYLDRIEAGGGTMMINGINGALDFPHDPRRLRFVCFLTDGYIGNERDILGALHERLGPSRVFSIGVGSPVNRYLLDHMAKMGCGAVAYPGPHDDSAAVMEKFFERISHPAMTHLEIDWGGMKVSDVFPRRPPDLFVGRPVILTGRFTGELPARIVVSGRTSGGTLDLEIPVNRSAPDEDTHPALPVVWARQKMADLATQSIFDPSPAVPELIKLIALDYGLMSPFTAFLSVDATSRTSGGLPTKTTAAVPVPDGVGYETSVHVEEQLTPKTKKKEP